ncbi:MAG: hypothetical protein GXO89_00950, partial [Chlorobi bacterium]|nr:hypothetical protein [Chlorobiota bacterium]
EKLRRVLRSLGLRKIGQTVMHPDVPLCFFINTMLHLQFANCKCNYNVNSNKKYSLSITFICSKSSKTIFVFINTTSININHSKFRRNSIFTF